MRVWAVFHMRSISAGGWDDAMIKARGQAERYVRALPARFSREPLSTARLDQR